LIDYIQLLHNQKVFNQFSFQLGSVHFIYTASSFALNP